MINCNNTPISFGTDGWRGIIAEDFTFSNVRICAQATAESVKAQFGSDPLVIVGYDTRFASDAFARTVSEVLAGNGIRVILSDKVSPTPAISHAVASLKASAGIVITASHNPYEWNGFKIKSPDGSSASPDFIAGVEKQAATFTMEGITTLTDFSCGIESGLITLADMDESYLSKIRQLSGFDEVKKAPVKICFDAMFGAGAGYLKQLAQGGNMGIIEINSQRNPVFPGIRQPEPISSNLARLSSVVTETGASVGLATDGDADRLGVIDEKGRFLNTLQVYSLLVLYLLQIRGERGAIVKTITSSAMLDRLGEIYGVDVIEVPVGFKHVAPVMTSCNALAGGEESGGYGFRGHIPERDGILSGLFFLDYVVKTGKKPSELVDSLFKMVGFHYYDRTDLKFPRQQRNAIIQKVTRAEPAKINGVKVVNIDTIDGRRFHLEDRSWLLIRFSGTEPLLRVYAEASTMESVARLLQAGKEITGLRDS